MNYTQTLNRKQAEDYFPMNFIRTTLPKAKTLEVHKSIHYQYPTYTMT